jgi:SAM-dependent MidA family methyltransferase
MRYDDAMTSRGNQSLWEKIRNEIRREGRVTFRRFMEMALYDPDHGYYMTRSPAGADRIGYSGDFYTGSDLHPVFGELIAKQLIRMAKSVPGAEPLTVAEIGCGKGFLSAQILSAIEAAPEALSHFRYLMIERSPAARERQKRLMDRWKDRIEWRDHLPGGLRGCVLSNELVDAFPVHRVVMADDGLKEIYVTLKGGDPAEEWGPPSTPAIEEYFARSGVRLDPSQKAEINLQAIDWMHRVGAALNRGYVITMDYGHAARDLYGPHRKNGTMICYRRHRAFEDPYHYIGQQDITAHVDFSGLARAGGEVGLSVAGFTDQSHFLMGLGIMEKMEQRAASHGPDDPEFLAMKRLMDPNGMGRTIKVLIQHKGVVPPPLDGLRFRPFFDGALND